MESESAGGFEALSESFALVCDVEGSSMIHGSANDGQAEGDIGAAFEVEEFERDMALVMVHADDGVEFAFEGLLEDGVGREWPVSVEAVRASSVDGRGDFVGILGAEGIIFTGVRVESGDGDALVVPEFEQGVVSELDDVADARLTNEVDGLAERDVSGNMSDDEFFGSEHHGVIGDAAEMGNEFRVAAEVGI